MKSDSMKPTTAGLGVNAQSHAKALLKKAFAHLGLELRRLPSAKSSANAPVSHRRELSPIFEDPFEALHHMRGGVTAAFHCPIAQAGLLNGLTFGPSNWNPFSKTALQILSKTPLRYEDTILRSFYAIWQPNDAAEAVVGLPQSCGFLKGLSPYLYYLLPWRSLSIDAIDHEVQRWHSSDYREHGFPSVMIDQHGFRDHGPVTKVVGQAEVNRLTNVLNSLNGTGYDRQQGDVAMWLLKRGDEIRFLNAGGLHRMAAADALGHETIPARFVEPAVVDIVEIDYWPQIRMGTWTRDEALRYFNHLFDFDAMTWARQQGL